MQVIMICTEKNVVVVNRAGAGAHTTGAFVVGASTSIIAGYVDLKQHAN